MGQKHESFHTIRTDLGLSGIDMSSSRVRTEESSLWKAVNCATDYRGTLRKRPFFTQIGHTVVEPTAPSMYNGEMVSVNITSHPDDWVTETRVLDRAYVTPGSNGVITFYATDNPLPVTGEHKISRIVKAEESYNTLDDYNQEFEVGFNVQANSLFSNVITADTDVGLHIGMAVYDGGYIKIGLGENSVSVSLDGTTYTQVASVAPLADGKVNSIVVRVNYDVGTTTHSTKVYLNGALLLGGPSTAAGLAATSGQFADIHIINSASLAADELCAGTISGMYVRDTADDATDNASIEEVFSRNKYRSDGNPPDLRVYAATSRSLWYDDAMSGIWRFDGNLTYPEVNIADFRDSVIVLNYGNVAATTLVQIQNDFSKRTLDDAPNISFATTYANRLWGAGDATYPLRLYFSADRDPTVWFSPDTDADGQETIDEVLGAGYFEIEGDSGDRILAIYGDFTSEIIVATDSAIFRLVGNSLETWRIQRISRSAGAIGPNAITMVGNDLWVVGKNGITSLRGVQEYGDLAAATVSLPIQNIFTAIGKRPSIINEALADKTRLLFDRTTDTVYLVLAKPDEYDDLVYTYRVSTGKWLGPWEVDFVSANMGSAGFPAKKTLLAGSSEGEVLYRTPISDPDSTTVLESQVLNGRSIDPRLVGMEKVWKNIRIITNPTGYWPVTIKYKVEDGAWKEVTKRLASTVPHTIDDTWTVGTSSVESAEEVHIIDFGLGIRGRSLKYEITCSAQEQSLVAVEVEFSASGFEKGD